MQYYCSGTLDTTETSGPGFEPGQAVQELFTQQVKNMVNSQVRHFGYGSKKRKLKGKLKVKSQWFRLDDIFSSVPNKRDVLAHRVYLCVPEYLWPAIGMPPCPTCGKTNQVRYLSTLNSSSEHFIFLCNHCWNAGAL